jgi:hypothetical protein
MADSRRGDKWAVTVYDPAMCGKRRVGTFAKWQEAKDAEADARKRVRRQHGRVACDEFANTWIDRYPRRRESTNIGHGSGCRSSPRTSPACSWIR